ncbi:MAG: alpha/beta fold hydrolase [Actinobacteria bacterium]|nr:alpha/beta fold hydrolase [Actinomycetota bacterium]
MTAPVLPGAEPWSAGGGPHAALVLHGFTGNPQSMRGLAEAFAAAGFAVEMPLLPGHGTDVADMLDTTWADYSSAAEDAYQRLAGRAAGKVVVAGLSMGGTLTVWLASRHPEVAGIVCVNPLVTPPAGMREAVEPMLADGAETIAGIGSDIAMEGAAESAYSETPLRPLLSLIDAAGEVEEALGSVSCPVLLCTSAQDHVVDPANSDLLAERVAGPVTRVALERSFHVATLDHDKDLIEREAVAFAKRVTG